MAKRGNGEGSISRRKDGGYTAQYYAEAGGVRKRLTLYAKTRGEAAARLAKAIADRDGGFMVDAGKLTVGEYLDRWLSDGLAPLVGAGKMAHSSYVRYEGIVRRHLKPALGHVKIRNLSRPQVRKLYAEKARTLSPRSVDYVHVTLQKALSHAMRDDLIPRNVATGERPRSSRQRGEVKALSPAQARALLRAARGMRNEALYVLALHTGLRQGELLGLKWADVDVSGETGRLLVRRSLKRHEGGRAFGSPKNGASRRSVPLNRTSAAALADHRRRQNEERLRAPGGAWNNQDLVFPNSAGNPTDHTNLYRREYRPLLARAGLADEGFTFHALRHSFATALLLRREHPKKVQALMGHSSIAQTMDTYSHLLDDIGGDAVDGLEDAFGG